MIEFTNSYDFLMKWKELAEKGEPLYDIHIPDYGTFINCKVIPEASGYTIEYSDWREDNATERSD